MKFLIDQDVYQLTIDYLRNSGVSALPIFCAINKSGCLLDIDRIKTLCYYFLSV